MKTDQYGQLTQTVDTANEFTETYSYDQRGNILTKTKVYDDVNTPAETTTFTYENSAWPDELTSVNGTSLTYDANGNVLTYGNMEFEWTNGRTLSQITVNPENENGTADVYSYTYDESGIRTSKTVNGVTTYFTTKDGVILSQTDGTNTMYFQYDNSGNPIGFLYNGTQYFYLTNQMGDVIGITDNTGSLIATYTYDAWGEVLATTPATAGNSAQLAIANANPLRYRGYYLDAETGYYYLQSRYYMPDMARFISCDQVDLYLEKDKWSGINGYAYCYNNPTSFIDYTGTAAYSMQTYFHNHHYTMLWGVLQLTPTYAYFATNPESNEVEIVIRMVKAFLSQPTCTNYANQILKAAKKHKTIKRFVKNNKVLGMTPHRIATEIWSHAIGYYCGTVLSKIKIKKGEELINRGNPINVNKNDPRAATYEKIWKAGKKIKSAAPKSIAKYIVIQG